MLSPLSGWVDDEEDGSDGPALVCSSRPSETDGSNSIAYRISIHGKKALSRRTYREVHFRATPSIASGYGFAVLKISSTCDPKLGKTLRYHGPMISTDSNTALCDRRLVSAPKLTCLRSELRTSVSELDCSPQTELQEGPSRGTAGFLCFELPSIRFLDLDPWRIEVIDDGIRLHH